MRSAKYSVSLFVWTHADILMDTVFSIDISSSFSHKSTFQGVIEGDIPNESLEST